MSLRAIRKRENQQLNPTTVVRQALFKKPTTSTKQCTFVASASAHSQQLNNQTPLSTLRSLEQQQTLLGRRIRSCPDLRNLSDTLARSEAAHARLVRTKSEGDVHALLLSSYSNNNVSCGAAKGRAYIGAAKSEICLQSITSHNYSTTATVTNPSEVTSSSIAMLPGRFNSHCDLTSPSGSYIGSPTRRRSSECSYTSSAGYSQRTSVMSTSAMTLSSNDPNTVMRVPIIGYEVMEERARFTVYKLRVENPQSNDCWLVLRRYTDFVRLNTKLKQTFPKLNLLLPRKKIFGDNFNAVFLDNRVQGLQMFVNTIMAKEQLRQCKLVREFFCLDEPPSYSESMEECRAIFEAQEETIAHLKLQISNKNDVILSLQQKLREEMADKEQLKEMLRNKTRNGVL